VCVGIAVLELEEAVEIWVAVCASTTDTKAKHRATESNRRDMMQFRLKNHQIAAKIEQLIKIIKVTASRLGKSHDLAARLRSCADSQEKGSQPLWKL
jgi:hypothetical protein